MTASVTSTPGRKFFLLHLWLPLVGALALLFGLEATDIDHLVSNWFYDAAAGRFPLRYNATFEIVMHQWARYVVVLIACAVIAAYTMSFVILALKEQRRLLLFLSLALALAPAAVGLLRSGNHQYCPHDLAEYGGYAAYRGLFDRAIPGQIPGRCFPSGHAAAGFGLLAFYFAGRALGNRRVAHAGLWGGLAAGLTFGMARVAQGAQFLSHSLWAALVCWLAILALHAAILGRPKGA